MSKNLELDTVYKSAVDGASKRHMSHYLPNFVVAFNSVSVLMTSAGTLSAVIHYDEASNATRPFILLMHLPFDTNRHSVYLPVLFLQFSYLLILSAGAATINSVLIILVSVCSVIRQSSWAQQAHFVASSSLCVRMRRLVCFRCCTWAIRSISFVDAWRTCRKGRISARRTCW